MEPWLIRITDYLLTQSWQIAILTIVAALATFGLRNRSAHVRYLLWLIVLAKVLVPPLYSVPLAVLPQQEPPAYIPAPPTAERMAAEHRTPDIAPTEPPQPIAVQSQATSSPIVSTKPPKYDTRVWLAMVWLTGVTALSFYYLLNALRTQIWLQKRRKALPSESAHNIEQFFASHGIRRRPHVWLLERTNQPFVWGLVRGSIYLPAGLLDGRHAKFQPSLLGHELSHVIRLDAMVNSLQVVAQTVFWFHPFVWWANAKIRAEREKCCDEMTIAHLNAAPEEYSEAIVETLAAKYEQVRPVPSLAVAGQVRNIEERIRTMLRPGKEFYKHPSFPVAAMVVLMSLLAVPTTLVLTVRAASQPPTESADADLIFENPTNLGPSVNSPDHEHNPSISADELELYFKSERPGGQGGADLWVATRKAKADPWGKAVNLGPTINSAAGDRTLCISADGLSLYFSSDRTGGHGAHDLWVTTRESKTAPWGEPVNLGPTVNSAADEHAPSISTDGLELYFSGRSVSPGLARPGGSGASDLWVTRRKTTADPWGTPANLGPTINSPSADARPSISADGLSLYFFSHRPVGPDGRATLAIWVTKRKSKSDPWGTPVKLGPAVNVYGEGDPWISKDGSTLYFSSARPGGIGDSDIWQVTLAKSTPESRAQYQLAASLYEVVKGRDIEQVRLLLAKGANVNARDGIGHTALYFAIQNYAPGMVELLVTKGADVNLTVERNRSLLQFAVLYGNLETVRLLVDHGAKLDVKDQDGWTALRHAAYIGKREFVEFFVSKGVGLPPALHVAACMGDLTRVKSLLEQGANVDAKDELGWTPLFWATCLRRIEVAKVLVANGANVQVATKEGDIPLSRAVRAGDRELVDLILSKGADVNAKDENGLTALHWAAMYGHREVAELLIAQGADVNARFNDGRTPLDFALQQNRATMVEMLAAKGADVSTLPVAARIGNLARVKSLLEQGANVNAQDGSGMTALQYAARDGRKEIVEVLLAKGANVNAGATEYNQTAADFAMNKNHSEIVDLLIAKGADISALHVALLRKDRAKAKDLIENGADVNKQTPYGTSSLDMAVRAGFQDIAEMLIAKGANVNAADRWGWTALLSAACDGPRNMVEMLVAHGANVNAADGLGATAAQYALMCEHTDIVELLVSKGATDIPPLLLAVQRRDLTQLGDLLRKGADVNRRTQCGTSPLHVAAKAGLAEIAAVLLDKGANVNATENEHRTTPLHDAARNGHKDVVELLIAKGAEVNASDRDDRTALWYARQKAHSAVIDLLQKHGAKE